MGFISSTVTLVADGLTFPISYIPKMVTGRTIGDYLTGTQRPPSTNGAMGTIGSFALDVVTAPVSLLARAFTGNSIGDYVTGDTNEKRQEAENRDLAQEAVMVEARRAARERGRAASQGSPAISTPSIGAAQAQGQMRGA